MQFGRTYDADIISLVIRELWDALSDDATEYSDPSDFVPRIDEDSRWYISVEDNDVVGVYWLRRLNHITWEGHVNVRPKYWASGKSLPHAQAVLEFMWEDSGAEKIVATIPDSSKQVVKFIQTLGFTKEGRRTDSFQKNGKLYDELYFGITLKR